jgi:hypothetical protein
MSVLAAETDLLQSARDYLRLKLSLTEAQCNCEGLAVKCDGVIGWLDFRYAVTTGANQLLAVHAPGTEPFMHPLVFSGGDGMPRWTPPGFWGETQAQLDAGNVKVGMMRKLSFRKARRITYRTGVA